METTLQIKRNGYVYKYAVKLEITDTRIKFLRSPFALKDEIKAMRGPRWHGFDKEDPQKIWSVENCARNVFQLQYLMGTDVYTHFDQKIVDLPAEARPELLGQQVDMVRRGLTYHFQIFAAEQGLGKSLVAIQMAELTKGPWWYVGPKSAGESFLLELEKWGVDPNLFTEIITYEALRNKVQYKKFDCPFGVIYDESTAAKTASTNRSKSAQYLADLIREETNNDGYVIALSGTPTAKSPEDIWSQAEICWPGFLREGSPHAFKNRYGYVTTMTTMDGVTFPKMEGWNEEEVNALPDRLEGLMTVYRKADWLDLPEKRFRRVYLEPSKKVLRVAKALTHVASSAAVALTWLRALSSGFQYIYKETGVTKECPACNMMDETHDCPVCQNTRVVAEREREPKMVKTPKCDALEQEIDGEHRVIVAAAFTGSIDRCFDIAISKGFAVCRVDGRGWKSYDKEGKIIRKLHPLKHWKDCTDPVCFIGNPGSCKFGLTLVEAKKMIFFDNDFAAESRLQMIDRFHRIGQTESPEVVDLIHLPVDERVLDILDANRSTELLSLGALSEALGDEDPENLELE